MHFWDVSHSATVIKDPEKAKSWADVHLSYLTNQQSSWSETVKQVKRLSEVVWCILIPDVAQISHFRYYYDYYCCCFRVRSLWLWQHWTWNWSLLLVLWPSGHNIRGQIKTDISDERRLPVLFHNYSTTQLETYKPDELSWTYICLLRLWLHQWLCRSDTTSCSRFSSTSGLLPFSGHALLLGESHADDIITSPSMVKALFLLTQPCRIILLMSDNSWRRDRCRKREVLALERLFSISN